MLIKQKRAVTLAIQSQLLKETGSKECIPTLEKGLQSIHTIVQGGM